MRGKPRSRWLRRIRCGSIPACAGETRRRLLASLFKPVHPRVCGGNARPCVSSRRCRGPSPRVRGKHGREGRHDRAGGSIPACAGETLASFPCQAIYPVHPRVCGGNPRSTHQPDPAPGPSPRVRGKPGRLSDSTPPNGSIPACAGKLAFVMVTRSMSGSIPACAGETRILARVAPVHWVHPRVCGGNIPERLQDATAEGPSPRVRGKHVFSKCRLPGRGSIPRVRGKPVCPT